MRVGRGFKIAAFCGMGAIGTWGCDGSSSSTDGGTPDGATVAACDEAENVAITGLATCSVQLPGGYYVATLTPYSGGLGESGPVYERPILSALIEANEAGGVHGRCVGLIRCDTADDLATGMSQAVGQLAEVAAIPEVIGVLGPASSGAAAGLGPSLPAAALPVITGSAGSARVQDPENWFFKTVGNGALRGARTADIMWANRAENTTQRIMVIHPNSAVWRAIGLAFEQQWRTLDPEGSIQYMRHEYNPADGTYASTTVDAIRAFGPSQVFISGFVYENEAIMTTVAASDVSVDHWYGIWFSLEIFESHPELLRAHRFVGDVPPNAAVYEPWAAAYQAAWGMPPSLQQPNYYDAAAVLVLAGQLSTDPTNGAELRDHLQNDLSVGTPMPGITAALGAIRGGATQINFEGVSGDLDFDAEGHVSRRYQVWDYSTGVRVVTSCVLDNGMPCPE